MQFTSTLVKGMLIICIYENEKKNTLSKKQDDQLKFVCQVVCTGYMTQTVSSQS